MLFLWQEGAYAQSAEGPAAGQIITAEEIEQAGIARLSDLFTLIDGWYATSIEGFTWDVSADALAPLQENQWVLLVDDQPIDLSILDGQNINILPIALAEIAYVEVFSTPTMISGVFAPAGAIHLHTRTPASGPSLQGEFAAGNEIGDPGPYRYTSFASPNIDRIGPTLQAAAAVSGNGWHLRTHIKSDEHHATDARILQRVRELYLGTKSPRLLLLGGGVDLGASGRLGRHTLLAGFSRFQDLRFYEPLGREGPTDQYFYHLGLSGDFWPGQTTGMRYRLSYTINDLDPRQSRQGFDFIWRQNALRGHYEVRAAGRRIAGALGLSVDALHSFSNVLIRDPNLVIPRAYARLQWKPGPTWLSDITSYLTRVEGEAGFGALATVHVSPDEAHTITLSGMGARRPYAEQNPIWHWVKQGYDFFDRRNLDVILPASFPAGSVYAVDLSWAYRPSDKLRITLSGGLRRFDDQTLPDYSFQYDSLSTGFRTRTNVRSGVFGRATTAGAEVRFRLVPSLEQRFYYAYVRYPTVDPTFFQAWRNQPWHRFSYSVRYVPLSRLSLYGRLAYFSATEWTGFQEAARDSGGLYDAQLPGYWLLDFAVQKRLWRDHIDLSVSLQNFLNEPYRLHPAGAITSMALHVRFQVKLGS